MDNHIEYLENKLTREHQEQIKLRARIAELAAANDENERLRATLRAIADVSGEPRVWQMATDALGTAVTQEQ